MKRLFLVAVSVCALLLGAADPVLAKPRKDRKAAPAAPAAAPADNRAAAPAAAAAPPPASPGKSSSRKGAAAAQAAASAAGARQVVQRESHIEFDERLVQGQTAAGAIYLFQRGESEFRSMVRMPESFRDRTVRPLLPSTPALPAAPRP